MPEKKVLVALTSGIARNGNLNSLQAMVDGQWP